MCCTCIYICISVTQTKETAHVGVYPRPFGVILLFLKFTENVTKYLGLEALCKCIQAFMLQLNSMWQLCQLHSKPSLQAAWLLAAYNSWLPAIVGCLQ